MITYLTNGTIYTLNGWKKADLLLQPDSVQLLPSGGKSDVPSSSPSVRSGCETIDCSGKLILPGFADVHVHFREPGFSYKETIRTGSMAAVRGGYTAVCTMPNLNPVPSTRKGLQTQLNIIQRDALCRIVPYGAITQNQDGRGPLSDMEELAPYVVSFTDDGKGIQNSHLMEEAMTRAKALGKIITAHCEDESLLTGGSIHSGTYARSHGYTGIPSKSEWAQVKRDIQLAEKTGAAYHVCHISTKESVEIIRKAKERNVDVTCETAPHYLLLSDRDLEEDGRFKMNPPLRDITDQEALLAGIQDGTIDMIATDHAPHSPEEKKRGLAGSAFGIVGLETAFPVLYTKLVKKGILSLEKLITLMAINPRKRFLLPGCLLSGEEREEESIDLTVIDPDSRYTIHPEDFASKGNATPFAGWEVTGKTLFTFVGGKKVYPFD